MAKTYYDGFDRLEDIERVLVLEARLLGNTYKYYLDAGVHCTQIAGHINALAAIIIRLRRYMRKPPMDDECVGVDWNLIKSKIAGRRV